ncbi:hypothetical protein KDL29_08795 [bacterium]|nr:hypothetical protein [bacterium]
MPELRLDPLSRDALLGLCYRALAGNAQPGRAAISRRRIEQLQSQRTELMKERSSLLTDEQTAQSRMKDAQRSARDARLDVQIYTENNPAPPEPKRGLFGRRPSRERREWEEERDRLAEIAGLEEAEAAEYASIHAEIAGRLQGINEQFDELGREYAEQLATLRGQLAAWVLLRCSGGGSGEAREELADYRRLLRGELSVAVLLVLGELFDNGAQAAFGMLPDLATIWEQHPDPLRPVLEALLRLMRDGRLERREAGMLQREQFSQPGHWNLYRLARILGGWPASMDEQDEGGFARTLWALEQVLLTQDPPSDWQAQPAEGLAAWSSGGDNLVQLLCCLALWQRGELRLIPRAAGIPLEEIPVPERRGEQWPELYKSLSGRVLTGWPEPLAGMLWTELACLVLLAAKRHAPDALYRHWLAESYNWPKTAMFWWTMATLQEDPELLRRSASERPGLIVPEPASL